MLKKYWLVAYCFLNDKGTVLVNNAAFYDSLAAWTASNKNKFSSRLFTLLWAQEITEEEFNHLKENTNYVS